MKANINFLQDYISDVIWEIIINLQNKTGSRFKAYCSLIETIGAQDAKSLDNNSESKGESFYLAAGICGEVFWSEFTNRVKRCITLDLEDGDLTAANHAEMLQQLLEVASAPLIPKKD